MKIFQNFVPKIKIVLKKAMDESMKETQKESIMLKTSYNDIFYEKQHMVDIVTRKDKKLVDLQIKMRKMTDNKENTLSLLNETKKNIKDKLREIQKLEVDLKGKEQDNA